MARDDHRAGPSEGTQQIAFRAGPLAGPLAERAFGDESVSLVAKRDLERYYEALRRELATVRLSRDEALLICDACNGTLFEPHSVPLLWAEIDEAIRAAGLAQKWGVDGEALVTNLRDLSYAQALAVVDAVERFWRLEVTDFDPALRAVGLL